MRIAYHISSTLIALSTLCLVNCALVEEPEYREPVAEVTPEPEHGSELVLHLNIAGGGQMASRATNHPFGGEDGDGRELGLHHENDIENVTVFHYKVLMNDYVDKIITTPIKKVAYIGNVNFHPSIIDTNHSRGDSVYTTEIPIAISQTAAQDYHFSNLDKYVVVANAGDVFSPNGEALTLGDVYDWIVKGAAWTSDLHGLDHYHDFLMSNERASVFIGGEGTKQNPYVYSVDIERVAARFDFCVDGTANDTFEDTDANNNKVSRKVLRYSVNDKNTEVGSLLLTHVRPFNVMQESSYLIKRLGGIDNANLKYLADEVPYQNYRVTEEAFPFYVIEPRTWQKGSTTASNLSTWYGTSRYDLIDEGWFTDNYRVHHKNYGNGVDGFNTGTTPINDNLCDDIYVLGYGLENTMLPSTTSKDVTTGFMLRGVYVPKYVYTEVNDMGEPTNVTDQFKAGQTFYRYRPMVSVYDETQSKYFASLELANEYLVKHPETPAIIETYEKGICYYPVYMRHDHSGQDLGTPYVTPMEFGTVRNNIYRLKVSFTGPGYNTIPDTPDEPLSIKPYIYVRKWYQISHPEIDI